MQGRPNQIAKHLVTWNMGTTPGRQYVNSWFNYRFDIRIKGESLSKDQREKTNQLTNKAHARKLPKLLWNWAKPVSLLITSQLTKAEHNVIYAGNHRTTSWCNSQNETITCGGIHSNQKSDTLVAFLSVNSHHQLCCTRHDHNNKRDIYGHSKNVWKYLKVFVSNTQNDSALYLSVQDRFISLEMNIYWIW